MAKERPFSQTPQSQRAEIQRAAFNGHLEIAASDGQQFRIRGYANTFGLMRSGRLIHRNALDNWLRENSKPDLALLANHGYVGQTYASLGRVDVLRVDPEKGLYFEAWVAQGTPATDETRALIEQRVLRALSLGWASKQARFITLQDRDLDPWIGDQLRAAGQTDALVFLEIEPVEISVVDVPDDAGAKLAASEQAAVRAALEPYIAELRRERDAERAAFREMIAEFWKAGENSLIETVTGAVLENNDYAEALLDGPETGEAGGCHHAAAPEHGASASRAIETIRRWAKQVPAAKE